MKYAKKKSNGEVGEAAAEQWFKINDWKMFRTQPATKVVYVNKKPTVINCGKGGITDFTGYRYRYDSPYSSCPFYIACEAKEATGDTMPCSRLKDQKDFMDKLPQMSRFVFVFWINYGYGEIFFYKTGRGSYKRGGGKK
jgi:hypothetical protein